MEGLPVVLLFRLVRHSYHKLNKKLYLGETTLREVTEDGELISADTVEIQIEIQIQVGVLPI